LIAARRDPGSEGQKGGDAMSSYSKLLVTTDFSDSSLRALDSAAALLAALSTGSGSSIELLYVLEDHLPPILGFSSESERRRVLQEQADRAATRLAALAEERLPGSSVSTLTRIGVAAEQIVAQAVEGGADLIVMASHGYGPLGQLLLGSTTERVLHRATCPVLVVPTQDRK
jgi:nucleotide-binding universal stress UspA family protein